MQRETPKMYCDYFKCLCKDIYEQCNYKQCFNCPCMKWEGKTNEQNKTKD